VTAVAVPAGIKHGDLKNDERWSARSPARSVGGGAKIARERGGNAGLKVVLSASQTIGDGWFATAQESAPIDEPWVLHVSVICVDAA
jgi:hypothetical protein